MKTINYSWTHKLSGLGVIPQMSHFAVDGVSFPLEKYTSIISNDHHYTLCPVWQHKANRTYLVRSPISFEFSFNKNPMGEYGILWDMKNNHLKFDDVVRCDFGWNNAEQAALQINHPTLAMWTKEKNIWYEVRPHAQTSAKNNFFAIGGWFNLSAWQRPSAFGMHVYDMTKPVKVNRGDVLFEVCFYSTNLDDKYKLVEHDEIPDKEWKRMIKTSNVKEFVKNFTKHLFSKQEEKKCPFAFLFNK